MQIAIQVESADVEERRGTSRQGRPYVIRNQVAYLKLPDKKYPVEISLTLEENQPAYAPGVYRLAEKSIFVGQYNRLGIRPVLEPVKG